MNSKPTEMQRSWREHVRLRGSVVSYVRGQNHKIEIHHPLGRTASHGVHIGHWFILPVLRAEHELFKATGLGELKDIWMLNHGGRWNGIDAMSLHDFEKFLFAEMCHNITVLPFDKEVEEAIQCWTH